MTTKPESELSLRDRLARLTFPMACRMLGPRGPKLIQQGGAHHVDVPSQVYFQGDLFRLRLPLEKGKPVVVTITVRSDRSNRMLYNCTACLGPCHHVGTALSVILEEKVQLGLAAPPPEPKNGESLTDEQLCAQALAEREQRAQSEKMLTKSLNPSRPWTDYLVTSHLSGKTYRVALRGAARGESYCSCPDFRKNTLGTCKHILHTLRKVRRRFTDVQLSTPYRQTQLALHLRYGETLALSMLTPDELSPAAAKIVAPLRDQPIQDLSDLMRRIGRLEAMGEDVLVYPDAEEYLQQRLFQERIAGLVAEIRRDPANHPLRRELLREELLPYQLDGIAFAVGAGRAILADEMGLGKTIQAIGVAEMLAREAGIRKVLIVTPASLKSQWRDEIRRFCGREALLVNGSAEERTEKYRNDSFFTVCNYEQVIRDILAVERVAWDLIILDEGQRIKNWETKTSNIIKGLHSTFALVLSGTPLENRLDELFSVVEFIDDRRLGPAFRFFPRHQLRDEEGKMFGYQRLDELRERLKPVLLRRTRNSVLSELPPRVTELIRIPPTDEQLELHRSNMKIVVQILSKPYVNEMDLLRLRRALLMCRLAANSTALVDKQHPGYSTKLQTLDDLFEQLLGERGRKIVLFSEWTSMLDLIEPLLKGHGADYVRLDGDVPQRARAALVHRFQNEPSCRLFITTNAGSTGLNLQAADTVINVDLPWNPAVLEQRIGRAHRMGQTKSVQVYVLVTEGSIEENLLETLADKQDLALAALDPDSDVDTLTMTRANDDLKQRLERLLGATPPAPLDESKQIDERTKAQRLIAGLPATNRSLLAGPTTQGQLSTQGHPTTQGQLATQGGSGIDMPVAGGASSSVSTGARNAFAVDGTRHDARSSDAAARESLAQSGGVLVSAALDFLSQLLPPQPPSPETTAMAETMADRLRKSVDRDEAGRPRFTLTLPDEATLEKLAATVAALFTRR